MKVKALYDFTTKDGDFHTGFIYDVADDTAEKWLIRKPRPIVELVVEKKKPPAYEKPETTTGGSRRNRLEPVETPDKEGD